MRLDLSVRTTSRIGIALGRDRLAAVILGPGSDDAREPVWSRHLEPVRDGPTGWARLAPAFDELKQSVGLGRAALRVALLPPLAQVRRVELPRLRQEELRRVLTRDAGRYFVGRDEPREEAVAPCGRARGSPVPYLLAVAEARALEAIHYAAAATGWRVDSVQPAYEAWRIAGLRHWPALRRGTAWLAVLDKGALEALRLEGGRLALVRRFPQSAFERCAAALAESAGASAPAVAIVGPEDVRVRLSSRLVDRGCRVLPPPERDDSTESPTESPEALAARFAGRTATLELVPGRVRDERARRSARLTTRLLAGAAASLVAAAGVELWGTHRELDAITAHREVLRAGVAQAMRAREALDGLDARLRALAAAEAGASRWSLAITGLAEHIPGTAHLTGLRGEADSLVVEGVAQRAAPVFESVVNAPEFGAVRAAAPIRQQASDSGPAIEHFTLAARLASLPARGAAR